MHAPMVLVVDDDLSITFAVASFLEQAGFRTATACDLSSALEGIRGNSPDLILMDVNLPDGSGLDLCRLLRSDTAFTTPVLFISASDDPSTKIDGFEAGGLDFITKPIIGAEVIARVRTHLRLKQAYDRLSELHADRLKDLADAQQTLMPRPSEYGSARFHASIRQVFSAGGDFYDVIPAGRDVVDYIVADASGHDLGASLWTAALKALAAEYASPLNLPSETVRAINNSLCRFMPSGAFFTLLYARLNHRTGHLTLVSAGHPPAIVIHSDGAEPTTCRQEGDVMGAFPDAAFGAVELTLRPGDRLWLYTDGLIENGLPYDESLRRIVDACAARNSLPLSFAVSSVVDDVMAGLTPADDLLLLGVNL